MNQQHINDLIQLFTMTRNPDVMRTQHQQVMAFHEQIKQYPDGKQERICRLLMQCWLWVKCSMSASMRF